ncbi:polyprenyl synthetase family protein [Actinomadura rudentiformis]|uniref:Polyprenyl synthetase family protein n=1 Tax=Actinomadura rudentiformis TaxID=359158 RepID=A0A6H9YKN9_9ACTN|nr:polyprenyl synthetase family protein [Actinomadura rudentiformis]KAB2346917.1 polyprenyl synthetase family protein [Actinomadura rudentiformis]
METRAATNVRLNSAAQTPRSAEAVLAEAHRIVQPAQRAAFEKLTAEIRHVAGYHAGWWDAQGRPAEESGKAVRPALAMACARAAGGDAAVEAAVPAAVAVELVHDFSLLHDDVMDGDELRRHRPTVWTVFGVGQAILVGDVLLTAAVQQLSTQPTAGTAVRTLTAAVQDLCAGQWADVAFEQRDDVDLAECLAMAEGKTGALLGAACELGAISAGAGEQAEDRYREFGRQLGVAFQLVDDLLGIWGDPAVTGKPAGSDLASRKRSLPVVAALRSGTKASRRLGRLYRGSDELDEMDVAQATELVEAAGGRNWATTEAERRLAAAMDALHAARPHTDGAADLAVLADLILQREH